VFFIGRDLTELRGAPVVLRTVFSVWVSVVAVTVIALVVA
jgi:hypothetical protein